MQFTNLFQFTSFASIKPLSTTHGQGRDTAVSQSTIITSINIKTRYLKDFSSL